MANHVQFRAPERLFEFQRGRKVIACELRDHGQYGVEAAFLDAGELFYSWRFDTREMAAAWAEIERTAIQSLDGAPGLPDQAQRARARFVTTSQLKRTKRCSSLSSSRS